MSEFQVLHALRVTGFADADRVSAATGLEPSAVTVALDSATRSGLAKERSGRISGYTLTSEGRERHAALLREQATAEQTAAVGRAYDMFLAPNQEFKALTTAWQTEGADARVVTAERLERVHGEVGELLAPLSAASPRFGTYEPRLRSALDAFGGGEDSALARPMSGSYHDVWMELHEDFLLTLDRERDAADG